MKTISVLTRMAVTAFATVLILTGCQKEQSASTPAEQQQEEQSVVYSAESETQSQAVFEDVTDNVLGVDEEVGLGGVGVFGRTDASGQVLKVTEPTGCVKVTITPIQRNVFPKTVVMDFGAGCTINGRLRSGKIITHYTGRLIEPGQSAITTFENYKIDELKVEGKHKLTNSTVPGANQRQFTVEVHDAKLIWANGNYEEWNSKRVNTQIEGNGTIPPADDIFRITGSSRGKTKKGDVTVAWNTEITEPLIKKFTCRWLSKGIIKTVREGLPANTRWVGIINFGNGDCDNKASLTINGNERQIVLK